ncbi:hypothetical protein CJJ23_04935 [Mycoplasmopsis agassizii]|uniref:Integrase catalytic domain-containing protein n=1 Tax=Mycoplasmopsis agassizii TaxID=33922 RepID=A0A269THD8_9BACT|nr:hypothetical protein CJJ23_04935 [Mycoplasmopsis agassizii]
MKYKQVTYEERCTIETLLNDGVNVTQIAKHLKRSKSTISREIKRNTVDGYYDSKDANKKCYERKLHKFFMFRWKYQEFEKYFSKYYDKRYCGVKATMHKISVFHPEVLRPSERHVFKWIKSRNWIFTPKDRLRTYYVKGGKRSVGIFSRFKGRYVKPIWARPKYIDNRTDFGHWEIDLIIGKRANGYTNVLTFNERMSRKVFSLHVASKDPFKINSALYKLIKQEDLPVKSITVDNGVEFSRLGLVAKWINAIIYACEPYASFQRGSNENLNGMIRRTFKKGTNFNDVTPSNLKDVTDKINNMPREMFGWKSSNEMYEHYLKLFK